MCDEAPTKVGNYQGGSRQAPTKVGNYRSMAQPAAGAGRGSTCPHWLQVRSSRLAW